MSEEKDGRASRFFRLCQLLGVTPESLARFMHIEVPEVPDDARPGRSMTDEERREVQQWEYKTLVFGLGHDETYNLFGEDGWELVAISPLRHGDTPFAVFKRPKAAPEPGED